MRIRRWKRGASAACFCITKGRRVFGDGSGESSCTCVFSRARTGVAGVLRGNGSAAAAAAAVVPAAIAAAAAGDEAGAAAAVIWSGVAAGAGATARGAGASVALLCSTSAPCDAAAATALAARRPHASSRRSFSICDFKSSTSWRASSTAFKSPCAEEEEEEEEMRGEGVRRYRG